LSIHKNILFMYNSITKRHLMFGKNWKVLSFFNCHSSSQRTTAKPNIDSESQKDREKDGEIDKKLNKLPFPFLSNKTCEATPCEFSLKNMHRQKKQSFYDKHDLVCERRDDRPVKWKSRLACGVIGNGWLNCSLP
jgi:hypothetical protein